MCNTRFGVCRLTIIVMSSQTIYNQLLQIFYPVLLSCCNLQKSEFCSCSAIRELYTGYICKSKNASWFCCWLPVRWEPHPKAFWLCTDHPKLLCGGGIWLLIYKTIVLFFSMWFWCIYLKNSLYLLKRKPHLSVSSDSLYILCAICAFLADSSSLLIQLWHHCNQPGPFQTHHHWNGS